MSKPTVAAIILAAGRSTRMGANKLLADVGGAPMVRVVAQAVLASAARPVLVVTGHQADEVRAALAGLEVKCVANPDFAQGLATSLKAGLRAVPSDADGVLVVLGDMPRVTSEHLDRLSAAFAASGGSAVVVPTHEGRRGNPVLWPRALFAGMLALDGDAGARRLLATHAARVREVDLATDAIFFDVDTPEALADLRANRHPGRRA
ncbi:MAG TPA: nucleotidyltransferase family protein [Hyphomicrobiaceae bacterium]|nr:nucleotidyltransferase family protein [Hyphomicrobiaceae bacterium]